MLDTRSRKKIDPFLDRMAAVLWKRGIKANQITAAALVFGIAAGVLVYFHWTVLGIIFFWFSGFLDALDGALARVSKQASLRGAVFDIVSDRIVELGIFWALALRHPESLYAMLALVSCVLISMTVFLTTGMLAEKTGKKSFYYQSGLMERTEGFIASTFMIIFQNQLSILTWIYAGLIAITIVQRLWETRRL